MSNELNVDMLDGIHLPTYTLYSPPGPKWRYGFNNWSWYVQDDVSWWRRFWVRFFFGGKWERLGE